MSEIDDAKAKLKAQLRSTIIKATRAFVELTLEEAKTLIKEGTLIELETYREVERDAADPRQEILDAIDARLRQLRSRDRSAPPSREGP